MGDQIDAPAQVLGEAYFLDLLGDAYNALGRHDEAIVALSEAAQTFGHHGVATAHGVCLFKLAQSHLAMARGEQAIGYLEKCLPIFSELDLPDHEEQALRALDACRTVTT
jgi:tetratricopeptide (TPR) repeat protein